VKKKPRNVDRIAWAVWNDRLQQYSAPSDVNNLCGFFRDSRADALRTRVNPKNQVVKVRVRITEITKETSRGK